MRYFFSHRTDHDQLSVNARKLSESSSAMEELQRENKRLKEMVGLLKSKNSLLLKAQKVRSPDDESEQESGSSESSEEKITKCQQGDPIVVDSGLSFQNI